MPPITHRLGEFIATTTFVMNMTVGRLFQFVCSTDTAETSADYFEISQYTVLLLTLLTEQILSLWIVIVGLA